MAIQPFFIFIHSLINNINSSVSAIFDPGWFVKKIDDIFDTNILYELQHNYTDYFKEYTDNVDTKIKDKDVKKICEILINIIFSVPPDMELSDGLKRLIDDCNIPPNKAKLLTFDTYPTYSKLMYDNSLLVYFEFKER